MIGSQMTAAICPALARNTSRTAASSLNGASSGVGVAHDRGTPAVDVVDVAVAVDVGDVGALGLREDDRVTADAAEGSDRGVDATWNDGPGRGHRGARAFALHERPLDG